MDKDYPQVHALFMIFLSIAVTTVVRKKSFSTLKRIKNYLRNSMGQNRLSSLSIINIEKDLVKNIQTRDIIDKFAANK